MRLGAIALLGGRCADCGIDDPVVLNIDHVFDDGADERRKLNPSQICARLVQGSLPRGRYQLLCCNCNWRKEYSRRTRSNSMVAKPRHKNQNDAKVACPKGHPYDYVDPRGRRGCRKCRLIAVIKNAKR